MSNQKSGYEIRADDERELLARVGVHRGGADAAGGGECEW